jgi:predicted Zn finger-like uncharacterized protein
LRNLAGTSAGVYKSRNAKGLGVVRIMILSCPNCGKRFRIDADKLGLAGRKVRCASCGHTWHATPDQDEEAAEAASPAQQDGMESSAAEDMVGTAEDEADAGQPWDDDDLPDGPPPFQSFEDMRSRMDGGGRRRGRGSARDRDREGRRSLGSRLRPLIGWLVFLAVVGGIAAGGWFARYGVVDTFPTAARLYDVLGVSINPVAPGLEIRDVKPSRRLKDGTSFLVIEGQILNRTGATQPVPALQVTLKDASGADIESWRIAADSAAIAPGDKTVFSTRKANPPSSARGISVVFIGPGS